MRSIHTASGTRSAHRTTAVAAATACFHTSIQSQTRARPWVHTKKRPAEPQIPHSFRPFEVPNVLLDLDSWDASYTRQYDKAEDEAQRKIWATNPRKDAMWKRVNNLDHRLKSMRSNLAHINEDISWQQWHVTGRDIMLAALRGPPGSPRPRDSHAYLHSERTVFAKNAIPSSTFQDDKRLLEWLLHRKAGHSTKRLEMDGLSRLIEKQTTTGDLHRLISTLLRQDQGMYLLSDHTDKIAAVLSGLSKDPDHVKLLPVLNSLFHYCQAQGYAFSPALCGMCAIISARALWLGALGLYLKHGVDKGYWYHDSTATRDVEVILRTLNWHVHKFKSPGGSAARKRPFNARPINELSKYPDHKEYLLRLLTEGDKLGGWFKKIVDSNPADKKLHEQYERVLNEVISLPSHLPKDLRAEVKMEPEMHADP